MTSSFLQGVLWLEMKQQRVTWQSSPTTQPKGRLRTPLCPTRAYLSPLLAACNPHKGLDGNKASGGRWHTSKDHSFTKPDRIEVVLERETFEKEKKRHRTQTHRSSSSRLSKCQVTLGSGCFKTAWVISLLTGRLKLSLFSILYDGRKLVSNDRKWKAQVLFLF